MICTRRQRGSRGEIEINETHAPCAVQLRRVGRRAPFHSIPFHSSRLQIQAHGRADNRHRQRAAHTTHTQHKRCTRKDHTLHMSEHRRARETIATALLMCCCAASECERDTCGRAGALDNALNPPKPNAKLRTALH